VWVNGFGALVVWMLRSGKMKIIDCKEIAMDISYELGYEGELDTPVMKYAMARYQYWINAGVSHEIAFSRAIVSGKCAKIGLDVCLGLDALAKSMELRIGNIVEPNNHKAILANKIASWHGNIVG
jgi:hypothetical protein